MYINGQFTDQSQASPATIQSVPLQSEWHYTNCLKTRLSVITWLCWYCTAVDMDDHVACRRCSLSL